MDPVAAEARLRAEARDVYEWSNASGHVYGEHSHGFTKVLVCVRGTIEFRLADGRTMRLGRGDRMVLQPGTVHSAVVGPEGCACVEGKL